TWKNAAPAGQRPQIEVYLADTADPLRSILLRHLLALDIDYRRLNGDCPAPSDYQPRFPSLSSRFLDEVFPRPDEEPRGARAEEAPGHGGREMVTTVLLRPIAPRLRSDRYKVRHFHDRGGIGEVWVAEDTDIGRQVALKRLRKNHESAQDRFLVEAQITGQLEHPGIVPVHDLGLDAEGRPFYVMTFVRGQTLKKAIDDFHSGNSAGGELAEVQLCRLLEVFVKT